MKRGPECRPSSVTRQIQERAEILGRLVMSTFPEMDGVVLANAREIEYGPCRDAARRRTRRIYPGITQRLRVEYRARGDERS